MAVVVPLQPSRPMAVVFWCVFLSATFVAAAAELMVTGEAPGAALFARQEVHHFRVQVSRAELDRLRQDPRRDVPAQVRYGGVVYSNVALHLKGRTGSFRTIDDKPGLTLDFDQFDRGQTLNGLTKIHLNNSVEDPGILNELLGANLFRQAGVPVARAAHARVELNGRDLGLYILKEGFTAQFLSIHFPNSEGNLYEPVPSSGPPQWRLAHGRNPTNALEELQAAVSEPDLDRRWQRLSQVLDLECFLSFMSLELMLCHRDGYCLAANNYRVYHDPQTGRFVFLPHGMDQLFGRTDLPLFSSMAGPVARALLEIPEARRRYHERATLLLTNLLEPRSVLGLVRRYDLSRNQRTRLTTAEAKSIRAAISSLETRITNRLAFLVRHQPDGPPTPLEFTAGVAKLAGWRPVDPPAGGGLDRQTSPDHRSSFHIRAGPITAASWRTTQRLGPGRYRFEARARTTEVRPLSTSRNQGAGLRVSGISSGPYQLTGHSDWTTLGVEFEVSSQNAEHEFVCELRARSGEVWFEESSLLLRRLP